MQRDSRDLTTCFVGVSFYQSGGDGNLETAVAQVFNERGDGVVVRGESAVPRGAGALLRGGRTVRTELIRTAAETFGVDWSLMAPNAEQMIIDVDGGTDVMATSAFAIMVQQNIVDVG